MADPAETSLPPSRPVMMTDAELSARCADGAYRLLVAAALIAEGEGVEIDFGEAIEVVGEMTQDLHDLTFGRPLKRPDELPYSFADRVACEYRERRAFTQPIRRRFA